MAKKVSYEALKKRIQELKKEIAKHNQTKEKLWGAHGQLTPLIEAVADAIYFKDSRGRYLLVNKACEQLMGLRKEQIIGKTDEQLLPPDLAKQCRRSDEEAMRSGKPTRLEEYMTNNKGEKVFFETIKSSLVDDKGTITGLEGISRDISNRMRADERVKEILELDEKILYGSPVAFVLHDRDLRIVRMSRAYKNVTGYDPDEVLGERLQDFMPEGPPKRKVIEGLKKVREKGVQLGPRDILAPTRREKYLRETVLPIFDSEGRVSHILSVLEDITERKRTDQALREKETELRTKAKNLEEVNTALRVY